MLTELRRKAPAVGSSRPEATVPRCMWRGPRASVNMYVEPCPAPGSKCRLVTRDRSCGKRASRHGSRLAQRPQGASPEIRLPTTTCSGSGSDRTLGAWNAHCLPRGAGRAAREIRLPTTIYRCSAAGGARDPGRAAHFMPRGAGGPRRHGGLPRKRSQSPLPAVDAPATTCQKAVREPIPTLFTPRGAGHAGMGADSKWRCGVSRADVRAGPSGRCMERGWWLVVPAKGQGAWVAAPTPAARVGRMYGLWKG